MCVYVAVDAPVKFCKLRIANRSGRARQVSITGYWELVLGDIRRKSLQHVVTESDQASGAILARNPYNPEFGDRVAFFNCSEANRSFTGDRTEFLGRNGKLDNPSAMRRVRLSRRIGAGYDPCAAFQTPLALEDGQERVRPWLPSVSTPLCCPYCFRGRHSVNDPCARLRGLPRTGTSSASRPRR